MAILTTRRLGILVLYTGAFSGVFYSFLGDAVAGSAAVLSPKREKDCGMVIERRLETLLHGTPTLRDQYPRMAKRIDEAVFKLRSTPLGGREIDTFEVNSRYVGPFPKAVLPRGKIGETIRSVYNRLQSQDEAARYVGKLMADAAEDTIRHGYPAELKLLKNGILSRGAVLRVLFARAHDRGERVGELRQTSKDAFLAAIRQGPFLDYGFPPDSLIVQGNLHGHDTHLLQRDFVAEIVREKMGGDTAGFYDYLGSPGGHKMWEILFDANPSFTNQLTSPAGVMRMWAPYLGTQ